MKKSIVLAAAMALFSGAYAQGTLEEGIKMVKYERYQSAEKILQPLSASYPAANYYLGLAELGQGNKDAAGKIFAKLPEDPANMAGMARVAYLSGNAAEGDRLSAAAADKAKKKDWMPIVYAADAINYGGGSPDKAIEMYNKALTRGDNVDIRIGLGDAYQKLQSGGGKSMDNYESATTQDPKNSLGYSRIGALWYAARNYNDALSSYAKAKDADPLNPIPYRDLANAYFYVNKIDLAKENVQKYYELSDKTCDDKIQYANIIFLAKEYANAIERMQQVINDCNEKPYIYRLLGYSYFETKDYDNALQNMRIFFSKQDPAKVIAEDYMYMGKIYGQRKQPDTADYYYSKAIALPGDSVERKKTLVSIAESFKAMNNDTGYLKSAQYYGKAVDISGPQAAPLDYFWFGVMNYYGKNYTEAAKVFATMEAKFPDEPSAIYWRARVAAAQDAEGKTGEGVPLFNKWLAIPNTEKYTKKPSDVSLAYQYLAIVAYNKDDKAGTKDYIAKLKEINPNDALAAQLDGLINKTKTTAPAKKPATHK